MKITYMSDCQTLISFYDNKLESISVRQIFIFSSLMVSHLLLTEVLRSVVFLLGSLVRRFAGSFFRSLTFLGQARFQRITNRKWNMAN